MDAAKFEAWLTTVAKWNRAMINRGHEGVVNDTYLITVRRWLPREQPCAWCDRTVPCDKLTTMTLKDSVWHERCSTCGISVNHATGEWTKSSRPTNVPSKIQQQLRDCRSLPSANSGNDPE